MPAAEQTSTPPLVQRVDAHMYRILRGREDPVAVIEELKGMLTGSPSGDDDRWHVQMVYPVAGDLSDIVDGFPVDHGTATEMIAQREIRDAAWDWLSADRTAAGVQSYVDRWTARTAALGRRAR